MWFSLPCSLLLLGCCLLLLMIVSQHAAPLCVCTLEQSLELLVHVKVVEREWGTESQKWQRARRSDREQEVSTEIYCKCKLTKREKWWRQMRDRDREWATEIDRESNLLWGSPYPAPCCCRVAAFYYSWSYHNMHPNNWFCCEYSAPPPFCYATHRLPPLIQITGNFLRTMVWHSFS